MPGKQKYILCRFSPDRGLLPGNDLTGDVVLLQLDKESDGSFTLTPASPKAARTATYRVAADVVCTVYCGDGGADARYAAALRIRPRRGTGASVQEMTNHTARMAALLGELRREMNGAVAESMQRGEGRLRSQLRRQYPYDPRDRRSGRDGSCVRAIPLPAGCPRTCGWLR